MPDVHDDGVRRRDHRLPDVRPLDPVHSLKAKLGLLVVASVTVAVLITWIGLRNGLGPSRTFPLAIIVSLVLTQLLARGMTSPLRQMTAAARAMADGDYSIRVRSTSRDEVGQLALAFNTMAQDLGASTGCGATSSRTCRTSCARRWRRCRRSWRTSWTG